MKLRKRKYGVWLHNRTDRRDDEWIYVWASSVQEAKELANVDTARFTLGEVLPVAEFRKYYGLGGM